MTKADLITVIADKLRFTDHGVWFDDDQRIRPARPDPGHNDPESAVEEPYYHREAA